MGYNYGSEAGEAGWRACKERVISANFGSKLGRFREVKIANFHSWDDHIEGLFARGTDGDAHGFHVRKHVEQAFVEAEVADTALNLSVFDQERAVASHARHHFVVGLDFANVPEAGDEDAALGAGNHLIDSLGTCWSGENNVAGHFSHFIGESEAMTCSQDGTDLVGKFGIANLFCSGAGMDELADYSVLDELHGLAVDAFAIERRAGLQRMRNVVPDIDVVAEELLADAVVKERALVEYGESSEIPEHEADNIENSSGFEDDGVFSGSEVERIGGVNGFAGCGLGKGERIEM